MPQLGPTTATLIVDTIENELLRNQIATVPVTLSRQRISMLPSPLKSPVPATAQFIATRPTPAHRVTAPSRTCHNATSPALLRQTRSPFWSDPTMVQSLDTTPKPAVDEMFLPIMIQ